MRIDVISIFPEFFNVLDLSLIGKAQEKSLVSFKAHNLRSWAEGKHLSVDDTPFGGGAGMVMKADVWGKALDEILGIDTECNIVEKDVINNQNFYESNNHIEHNANKSNKEKSSKKVLLIPSPSGKQFNQKFAQELSESDQIVFACGRYEGIDYRVYEHYKSLENENFRVEEFSIGDYVLNGGEVASVVVIEAVTRLIPGMVGNPFSLVEESHCDNGFLEYPVYTRPALWKNKRVPEVLLSGNHENITRFRRNKSIEKTISNRLDILLKSNPDDFDEDDKKVLIDHNIYLKNNIFYDISYKVADLQDYESLSEYISKNNENIHLFLDKDAKDLFSKNKLKEMLSNKEYLCVIIQEKGKKKFDNTLYENRAFVNNNCNIIGFFGIKRNVNIPNNTDIDSENTLSNIAVMKECILEKSCKDSALILSAIEKILKELKSLSCDYLGVETYSMNKNIIKLLKKIGFSKYKNSFKISDTGKIRTVLMIRKI